jgi:HK97 family phage portal protein
MGRLRDMLYGPEDRSLRPITQPMIGTDVLVDQPVLDADQNNALRISDAYACVRAMADDISSLPVAAFRDTPAGHQAVGPDALISRLLARPWPGATCSDLFAQIVVHLLTTGNAYVGKFRGGDGTIVQLGLLDPMTVQVELWGQRIVYRVWLPDQDTSEFGPSDVLHIKAMSQDGLHGLSPVTQARLALTISANLQESTRQFFANGSRPSGILEVSGPSSDFTVESIRDQWDTRHRGTENHGRIAVVSGAAKFTPVAFSADDSQFLQQRELSAREVARVFGIPAWRIDAEQTSSRTYASVTQQNLFYVQHSLRPWLARIERAFTQDADLCIGQLCLKFDLDGLLRGDPDLRTQIYQRALGSSTQPGWMNRAEIRELDGLPPEEATPNG